MNENRDMKEEEKIFAFLTKHKKSGFMRKKKDKKTNKRIRQIKKKGRSAELKNGTTG